MKKRRKTGAEVLALPVVALPQEVFDTLTRMAESRGVDVATFIRVGMMNLQRRAGYYDLGTKLRFGKYADASMEDVIRCDPGYVEWAARTLDSFELSAEALALLGDMGARLRKEAAPVTPKQEIG